MIKHVNLDQGGLGLFLGRAEISIMRALWHGSKNVSGVHNYITKNDRPMAYSTVHTILVRLVQKGLIDRIKPAGEIAMYAAVVDEHTFIARSIDTVISAIYADFPASLDTILKTFDYHNTDADGYL